ncbi:MAG: 1,2-diacylglycerol 3-alpha-glucosyltransferase, partial [Candidatus Azotimanducaceae bacterium]
RSEYRDQIQIRIVGTGPLQEKLDIQAAQLGLCAEIGPADDEALKRCYQTADLFVHGGEVELEGMSVLEAMAAGNAVLVSDSVNSATMEFVTEEDSRFRQGDVVDLTTKIDLWLANSEARKKSGADNRERAAKRHHQRSVDQLLQVYERYARGATSD